MRLRSGHFRRRRSSLCNEHELLKHCTIQLFESNRKEHTRTIDIWVRNACGSRVLGIMHSKGLVTQRGGHHVFGVKHNPFPVRTCAIVTFIQMVDRG